MTNWSDTVRAIPDLAGTVRRRLAATPYALLGSVRADGHPRISGVIVTFSDTDLWLAMPASSAKVGDLRREPRMSLHSPVAPGGADGDVKLHGRAVTVGAGDDEASDFLAAAGRDALPASLALFRIDVVDVAWIRLAETRDHHLIDSWRAGEESARTRRDHP